MYDKLRDHGHWVLPEVLASQARTRGAETFVAMLDGDSLTYAQAEAEAARVAGFFTALGVRPGDTVAVMLPNGLDLIRAWLGLGRLGAIFVALNTGLKGAFLEHQLRNSGAHVALVHRSYLDVVDEVVGRAPALAMLTTAGTGRDAAGFAGQRGGGADCVDCRNRQAAKNYAEGTNPHKNNLFRRPPGLADGLALKEPALLTVLPWDSPQQLGSPVP